MSRLFYVMAAPGAGKDSVMTYARRKLNGSYPVLFALRYITRPLDVKSQNQIHLTLREFKFREKNKLFSMHWQSNGHHYAVGKEINYWMYQGFSVVVSGSREYLPEVIKKYKDIKPILIETSHDVIVRRLSYRYQKYVGETKRKIANDHIVTLPDLPIVRISNDGPIETSGKEFLSIITGVGKALLTI